MILGKVKGNPLHGFRIRGHIGFMIKDRKLGGASAYRKSTDKICTLAPPDMSYHQAALESVAVLERGEFR